MNFNFAKAAAIITALIRTSFGWIRTNQADSHNDTFIEQSYLGRSAGSGMFGLLVSSDVAQVYLR